MMPHSDWPKPDLLRQRRIELGLPPETVVHEPFHRLLLKGAVFGLVLMLTPWALLLFLQDQQNRLQGEILDLAEIETRVGNAQARLNSMATNRASLNQQTNKIAAQLVALRSGSALFEQIRRVTPQGVRLLSVKAFPAKLLITGESEGRDAFERVNALALNFEEQDEFLRNGATVTNAVVRDDSLVDFSMEAMIDSSVRPTPERLRDLGAEGLALRHELLQTKEFEL